MEQTGGLLLLAKKLILLIKININNKGKKKKKKFNIHAICKD